MSRQPEEKYISLNGFDFCYFEWPGDNSTPILLLHATGFHARTWDQTIAHLPVTNRVIALDIRGHGRSSNQGSFSWPLLAEDVVAFIDALELTNIVVAGHSMGGCCSIVAASQRPTRFKSLVLVDPVVLPRERYASEDAHTQFQRVEDHPISRRRNQWRSPDDMFSNFKERHPFNLWLENALYDYCQYGLVSVEDHYELACPPHVEAQIYMHTNQDDIHDLLGEITQPVTVMRATPRSEPSAVMDFAQSPTDPELAQSFQNGRDVYLPELSHFIPMQRPDLVADEICASLFS